jgi:ComF family protein
VGCSNVRDNPGDLKRRYNFIVHLPQIVRDVVDFIYPGRCAACGDDSPGGELLCHGCDSGLDNLAVEAACERCALPVVSKGAPCPWCRGRGLYPFEKIVRLGKFAEPLRELIHSMKYHHRWTLAESLADRMLCEERVKQLINDADVLVPVPLHWSRQIGRGYNQADVLAGVLAGRCGLPVARPMKRIRRTPSQTGIHSRTVREENVRGAFALTNGDIIRDKRVVVVDDVMTTGATLQTVGRLLKSARPHKLSALVVAVADPKGQDFQII